MSPHIFQAISDDPAHQFGCMAALFHLFHHYPRFSSRVRTTSPAASSSAADHTSKTSTRPAKTTKVHRTSKDGKQRSPGRISNSYKRSATHLDSPTQAPTASSHKTVSSTSNESPSILTSSRSTNYTIRESPQKYPFNGRAISSPTDDQAEFCVRKSASSTRSSPSSPHVPLAQALKEARRSPRSGVCKSLFVDKPRGAADHTNAAGSTNQYVMDVHDLASLQDTDIQPRRSRITEDNLKIRDGLACKDPSADLLGLQESVKALKQFVDGFEAQLQQNVKPARKSSISNLSWWSNARSKSRLFKSADQQVTGPEKITDRPRNGLMEASAARTSSFDYNEAVRISQKIEQTPARLSLDGRELVPKAVMKLREAMRLAAHVNNTSEPLIKFPSASAAETTACVNSWISAARNVKEESASPTREKYTKGQRCNVIARLMGLDSLPASRNGAADHSEGARAPPLFLFKDLQNRCPQRASKLDQTDYMISRSSCMTSRAEQIRQHDDAAVASTSPKIEASSVSSNLELSAASVLPHCSTGASEAGRTVIKEKDEDCDVNCKIISEVQINESGADSSCLFKQSNDSYNNSQLKMRHSEEGIMPSSAYVTSSCRQSSRRRKGAAVDGYPLRDTAYDWKEGGELRHSAAYSKNHVRPCKIVVMEPRVSTRKSFADHQYVTTDTPLEKLVTPKCSYGRSPSAQRRAAHSHNHDASVISANLAFDKTDVASSNFCISDSYISRKHKTSAQQKGVDAQINKALMVAVPYSEASKVVKGCSTGSSLKSSPPSSTKSQRGRPTAEEQRVAVHARGITSGTPRPINYGDRSNMEAVDASKQESPGRSGLIPNSKSGSRLVFAASRKRVLDLEMTDAQTETTGQRKIRAAPAAEPKERRAPIAGGDERRGGRKADVLVQDKLSKGGYPGTMETVIHQGREQVESLTSGFQGFPSREKPSAVLAMEYSRAEVGDAGGQRTSVLASHDSSSCRLGAPSRADDHHSLLAAAGEVLSDAPADLSTSHKKVNNRDVTGLTARSTISISVCNAGQRPPHINEADIEGWIDSHSEHTKGVLKFSLNGKPPSTIHFSSPTSNSYSKDFLCCSMLLDNCSLEHERKEGVLNYWTCCSFPPPFLIFHPIFFSLEDAIFQDLLLEIF